MDAGWRSAWSGWRGWSATSCPRLTACSSSSRQWRSPRARRSRTWASCLTASPTTREVRGHTIELQNLITAPGFVYKTLIIWASFTSLLHWQNFETLSHDFQKWLIKFDVHSNPLYLPRRWAEEGDGGDDPQLGGGLQARHRRVSEDYVLITIDNK